MENHKPEIAMANDLIAETRSRGRGENTPSTKIVYIPYGEAIFNSGSVERCYFQCDDGAKVRLIASKSKSVAVNYGYSEQVEDVRTRKVLVSAARKIARRCGLSDIEIIANGPFKAI